VTLDRAPKRRARCPHCGRPIAVRRGGLFTDDEAHAIDACLGIGIPLEQLWAARDELSRTWGHQASAADAAWRVLNELVVSTPNLHERGGVYFHMARFLWEEGRDQLKIARQGRRMHLAEWKAAADEGLLDLARARIVIITGEETSCPACRALEGTLFTYEQAIELDPVPVPECTHDVGPGRVRGWCACLYGLRP
jgi:hypothetical protein